jgi:hypothetical protein
MQTKHASQFSGEQGQQFDFRTVLPNTKAYSEVQVDNQTKQIHDSYVVSEILPKKKLFTEGM